MHVCVRVCVRMICGTEENLGKLVTLALVASSAIAVAIVVIAIMSIVIIVVASVSVVTGQVLSHNVEIICEQHATDDVMIGNYSCTEEQQDSRSSPSSANKLRDCCSKTNI